MYSSTRSYTIAMNVIAFLFYILPINEYIDAKLSDGSNFIEEMPYQEARNIGHFAKDYDRMNPLLMGQAIKKEIDFLLDSEKNLSKRDAYIKLFYPKLS